TSRVGKGTRFRLRLPLAQPLAPIVDNTAPAPTFDLRGKVALIVDDEPDVRDSMAAALSAKGCIVVVASQAADAINGIAQLSRPPDFAVMDFRLETQSGLAALSEVRDYLGWCLPALIVTGDSRIRPFTICGHRGSVAH
ncbi:MAG TPA: response regulator, partial [Casimicrobium sp.]|nr:response regulator [Casimicrobium sp.]